MLNPNNNTTKKGFTTISSQAKTKIRIKRQEGEPWRAPSSGWASKASSRRAVRVSPVAWIPPKIQTIRGFSTIHSAVFLCCKYVKIKLPIHVPVLKASSVRPVSRRRTLRRRCTVLPSKGIAFCEATPLSDALGHTTWRWAWGRFPHSFLCWLFARTSASISKISHRAPTRTFAPAVLISPRNWAHTPV